MAIITWQEKAEWLRENGYLLQIYALAEDSEDNWMACVGGEGRRYAKTIEVAIEQVYDWIIKDRCLEGQK
jgi:hypothetical protein